MGILWYYRQGESTSIFRSRRKMGIRSAFRRVVGDGEGCSLDRVSRGRDWDYWRLNVYTVVEKEIAAVSLCCDGVDVVGECPVGVPIWMDDGREGNSNLEEEVRPLEAPAHATRPQNSSAVNRWPFMVQQLFFFPKRWGPIRPLNQPQPADKTPSFGRQGPKSLENVPERFLISVKKQTIDTHPSPLQNTARSHFSLSSARID